MLRLFSLLSAVLLSVTVVAQVGPPPPAPTVTPPTTATGVVGAVAGAAVLNAILPTPPASSTPAKPANVIGPDLNKLYLCKRDVTQDPNMCKQYITFFCAGYCTHDGCSDCSNRGICLDVCGETGATMMACVEANKNCTAPDQIFGNFLTSDAKTAITQYASIPGQPQYLPPSPPMASPYGAAPGMPGMMPGMGMPGMMPGMGMPGMMPGMGMPGMMPGMGMPGMMPGMGMGGGSATGMLGALGGMAAMSMMSRPAAPPAQ